MGYKYHTAAEYDAMIRETEAQVEEQYRLDQIKHWMSRPENNAQLQHIRRELDRVDPRPTQQRVVAQPSQPGKLPVVIDNNQRFHPSHMRLKPSTPQVQSVGDPYVFSPGATIRQR